MEFLLRAVLITEVISALNCVCRSSVQETHAAHRPGDGFFCVFRYAVFFPPSSFCSKAFIFCPHCCVDLNFVCQLNWVVLFFLAFLIRFLFWTLSGCFFSPWPFFFASFCSRFCSVVEPNHATLEVDTEQLVKPYLLSTTAFCHRLYAHMCLSPISAIILELREERNLRCWFVLFCFPCLGFYKRAENRFWPAMAWTVYCSCPDMPRDKYAKTFSFIYVQYIQTVSFFTQ